MKMPFTVEQFLNVFEQYNRGIWPAQTVAYLLGIVAVLLCFTKVRFAGKAVTAVLALFWLWMGAMYHWTYFSAINKAAYVFGAFFVIQGVLFLFSGIVRGRLSFRFSADVYAVTGLIFVAYAMIIYPLIGSALGHGYPRSPSFGVAPCPTTIFTFGLLLWTGRPAPKYLLIIPLLWSLLGFSAAQNLGIREDAGLFAAGVLGTLLIFYRDRKTKQIIAAV